MTDNQISPKMDCHGPANVGKLVADQPSDTNDDRPNITHGLAQLSEAAEAVQKMRSEKEDGGGQVFRHTAPAPDPDPAPAPAPDPAPAPAPLPAPAPHPDPAPAPAPAPAPLPAPAPAPDP